MTELWKDIPGYALRALCEAADNAINHLHDFPLDPKTDAAKAVKAYQALKNKQP